MLSNEFVKDYITMSAKFLAIIKCIQDRYPSNALLSVNLHEKEM